MFILWYSASSTFGKDSDIVMGVRAQQKEKTRRSLVEAAFSQLSAERSFASLSLREVAREAGHCSHLFLSAFPRRRRTGSDHG
ncbi:TetR-family transcriptional regulator [Escherichia coli]|uniref:TetR-family transcriptional regulator n=1 Tax=Escherichia coli TaxID=562 RepID=A0A377DZG1_ECOLX|nr:TetR-family transcriptional regulator [Escherichia coli]